MSGKKQIRVSQIYCLRRGLCNKNTSPLFIDVFFLIVIVGFNHFRDRNKKYCVQQYDFPFFTFLKILEILALPLVCEDFYNT